MTLKAIETQYKGYKFRSRLEARWAVFFDALGIAWEYEKEGYDLGELGWYLPDFWLPDWGAWAEVKPTMPTDEEIFKLMKLAESFPGEGSFATEHIMLVGTPGKPQVHLTPTGITTGDGYVALAMTGRLLDGLPLVVFSCFAMVSGCKVLDVWPMYMEVPDGFLSVPMDIVPMDLKGNNPNLLSMTMCHGFMRRLYIGKGVSCYPANLMMAYQAARSARFEHGETPRVRS